MNNSYFSNKITLLNVFLTFCIVTMHAIPLFRYGYTLDWHYPVIYSICVFTQIAVPMFFFISGLLFYKTCTSYQDIYRKLKSRVRTLLIPYLLWNLIFVSIYFTLYHIPLTHSFVSMGSILTSPEAIIHSILNSRFTVLWFVKNLIIYSIMAPILFLALKSRIVGFIVLLCSSFLMFYFEWTPDSMVYWFPTYFLGCFYGSNYNSIDKYLLEKSLHRNTFLFLCIGIFVLLYTLCLWKEQTYIAYFRLLSPILIFTIVNGFLFDYLTNHFEKKKWMSCMFFIYCCHHFLLTVIQKGAILVLPRTDFVISLIFILSPILVIYLLVCIYNKLSKYKFYQVLVGGR